MNWLNVFQNAFYGGATLAAIANSNYFIALLFVVWLIVLNTVGKKNEQPEKIAKKAVYNGLPPYFETLPLNEVRKRMGLPPIDSNGMYIEQKENCLTTEDVKELRELHKLMKIQDVWYNHYKHTGEIIMPHRNPPEPKPRPKLTPLAELIIDTAVNKAIDTIRQTELNTQKLYKQTCLVTSFSESEFASTLDEKLEQFQKEGFTIESIQYQIKGNDKMTALIVLVS